MKNVIIILLYVFPIICFTQNNFYLGFGSVSSFSNTIKNHEEYKSKNITDFGLYYGNKFLINNYFKIVSEIFYLNNNIVLARNENKRFELHQNIGLGIKPGLYLGKHSVYLTTGILAVYVFDKDEVLGNQIDRFDEAYFYGLEYNYDITQKITFALGLLHSEFESISHFTEHTLKSFSVLQLTLHYNLY